MTTATSRALVLIFAVAGLAAATTSTYVHYRLLTVPDFTSFCDVNSTVSCAQAYLSSYGELGGVPVAILGRALLRRRAGDRGARLAAEGPGAARRAVLHRRARPFRRWRSSAYLAYAAFVVLNAFCILCAISYVAVVGITLVAWRAPRVPLAGSAGTRLARSRGGGA